jgi:hypothetical protein
MEQELEGRSSGRVSWSSNVCDAAFAGYIPISDGSFNISSKNLTV